MPVINGVYLKDFTALPGAVADANIIPIAITGDNVAYRTTVAGIVTDARVTSKLLTGLSVTGGAVVAADTILQAFGKVQNQINSKVSSVGLTMPSAFNVANSPITSSGTLAVTAAGVASQYIRGDGALADFPTNGGGGSSVSYYLNGSVNQGTFVGNTYYEMNKTPVIGTGTDFTIGADGYIAQFITDANDPASLLIPAGNWNVEMYFSASSNGGTPSFYVEVYKYNGTTFTLLGTSSATPEGITNGTAIDIYYTSVGIPETVLTITDRLAIRVYVTHSGRTITLHTEDNHLSEIVTTFSNGINTLNGLTKQAQYFAVGSTGTDFAIVSSVDTHTFNLPTASASNRGALSSADWSTFNGKQGTITLTTTGTSGAATFSSNTLNIPNYATDLSGYVPYTGATQTLAMGTNNGITLTDTGSNTSINVTSSSSGQGAILVTKSGNGEGIRVLNGGTGSGFLAANTSTGIGFYIDNASTGIGLKINNNTSATGDPFIYTLNGVSKAKIDYLGNITGVAGTFTGQLTLGSTITNGTYTYTLPSATGTLALTSALSDYLPLTGGTLTGGLSGTSASFSSTATATAFIPSGATVPTNGMYLSAANTLNFATNTTNRLSISSTGAATFSSSVKATTYEFTGAIPSSAASTGYIDYSGGGARFFSVGTSGATKGTFTFIAKGADDSSITPLTIASTGEATFTNKVTARNGSSGVAFETTNAVNADFTIETTSGGLTKIGSSGNILAINSSGGNVLIGVSSTGAYLDGQITASVPSGTAPAACFKNLTSSQFVASFWNSASSGDNSFQMFLTDSSPTSRGTISYNRSAGLVAYNTTSDYRLKSEIEDFNALDIINNLNPKEFRIGDAENKAIGFIAHELQEYFPQAVSGEKDAVDEEGNAKYQGVDYSQLTGLLVKAIQELKAEIDLLKGKPIAEVTPEPIIPTDNNLE